jgi:uncharacterized Zn finger protein
MDYYDWKPYVPVAARRAQALREAAKLAKKGQRTSPIVVGGRKIARTFWGAAWCDNLERYSDYANRLPRGRSYVRNGSVIDLQVTPGMVRALVSGSELYEIQVNVAAVQKRQWTAVCHDCAGAIDSLVELLQGRFSKAVMARICQQKTGLFPSPAEITFSCSCPDWASMCKHVAAVLYGIGARLDEKPELLFALRRVDHQDLITQAGSELPQTKKSAKASKVLDGGDLSEMFGIEMAQAPNRRGAAASGKRPPGAKPVTPSEPASRPRAKVAHTSVKREAPAGTKLAGQRVAVSKRMKAYWLAWRQAKTRRAAKDD